MAKLICVLISVFALCALKSATGESIQTVIFGGQPTINGAFPSVVSITSNTGVHPNCLGNVINDWHVLTAASCVTENNGALINPFWITVTGGDLVLNAPTWRRVVRNVTTIYPHHQFNINTNANNLAVLRMGARFPFPHNTIEAATLATQPINTGCRFAGWSAPSNVSGAVINPIQQFFAVPILTANQCNVNNVLNNQVQDGMICGGLLTENAPSPCPGALGGGLYCGNDNQLVGVLAFNTGCGVINRPGVYIDVSRHLAWINQQFVRTIRFRPGTLVGQTAG